MSKRSHCNIAVADSGLNYGSAHTAFDRAWLARHAQGTAADLLRFYRYRPTASIGLHQAIDRELRLTYCRRHRIEVVRRLTGGGALYHDPGQEAFTLIIHRPTNWQQFTFAQLLECFCDSIAQGLTSFGITPTFSAPNEVAIDGRKIASVFGTIQGDSLLLQGTVLLEIDIKTMMEALRAPTEKLSAEGLGAARDRLISLRDLLGNNPDRVAIRHALAKGITGAAGRQHHENTMAAAKPLPLRDGHHKEINRIRWRQKAYEALWQTIGGTIHARLTVEENRRCRLEFAGDLQLQPDDWLQRLERRLTNIPLAELRPRIEQFCREAPWEAPGFGKNDILHVAELAATQWSLGEEMALNPAQAHALMAVIADPLAGTTILAKAEALLVPYCAKPNWCKWRHHENCIECGKCAVGEAYRLGRERGLAVTTILNYAHLETTLAHLKRDGAVAYLGMCCRSFFQKRHRAFRHAGLSAILMDIGGANCYRLKQEDQAYIGQFHAEASIDLTLLRRALRALPCRAKHHS